MHFVPKPKTFIHFMSLKTGAELICIFTVFNKASGLYGMLALLTGAPISAWQMSMYLYSLVAAAAFAYSLRHIKAGPSSVVEVLGFAWFYLLDTLINFAYTALFATTWFMVLSQQGGGSLNNAMNETAGFTNPSHTVSSVTVVPTDVAGTHKSAFDGTPASQPAGLGESVLHPEQYPSIFALGLILLVKVYFILVVMSFARSVYIAAEGSTMSSFSGWRHKAYRLMTRGAYWNSHEDMRLSKARSIRRDEQA